MVVLISRVFFVKYVLNIYIPNPSKDNNLLRGWKLHLCEEMNANRIVFMRISRVYSMNQLRQDYVN